MNLSAHIAKHMREVHFGGNWTSSNLKDQLADVTWQEATTQVYTFNTIAVLVFHMNYYVHAVIRVLQGEGLEANDKYSFDLPPLRSEEDWQHLKDKALAEAETLALLIEQMPEEKIWEPVAEEKYGIFYRNLHGIIEHCHYHLGQVALIKKMVRQTAASIF